MGRASYHSDTTRYERKRGIKDDCKGFGLTKEKQKVVISWYEENCEKNGFEGSQEFGLEYIKFEMCVRHPIDEDVNLEVRNKIETGNTILQTSGVEKRLDEIT